MRKFIYAKGTEKELVYYAKDNREVKDQSGNVLEVVEDPIVSKLLEQGYEEQTKKTK